MSPVLRYHTGGGVYADLPGSIEEVTVSPNQPPVNTDLWVDTDDDTGYVPTLLSGFRNIVRNGDMSIRQRGNTFTVTNLAWQVTLDGWKATHGGGTTAVVNAAPIGPGTMPLTDAQYVLSAGQASGNAASNYFHLSAQMEDVRILAGKVVTLSFVGYVTSGTAKVGINYVQNFGGGGSPSAEVPMLAGTVNLTSTPTRHSVTFQTPSIVGKTIGTDNNSYSRFQLWISGGTDYAAGNGGIPVQLNTFCFTDIQLEEGGVATPFERIPIQQQLAWCQRYFQRIGPGNPHHKPSSPWATYMTGVVLNATNAYFPLLVPLMRAIPVVTFATPASQFAVFDGSDIGVTVMGTDSLTSGSIFFFVNTAGSLVAGHSCFLESNNNMTSYIDLSAEL